MAKLFIAVAAALAIVVALVAFLVVRTVGDGDGALAPADAAARAAAANQAWVTDVENGKTLHVVDDVYELSTEETAPGDAPFQLPESTVQELWLRYPAGVATVFCVVVSADGTVLQRTVPDGGALASINESNGARIIVPGSVYTNVGEFRDTIEQANAAAATTPGAKMVRRDTSLGRPANVMVLPVEEHNVEQRRYFDATSGEEFASEHWFVNDNGERTLLYRRVRTIATTDDAPVCT